MNREPSTWEIARELLAAWALAFVTFGGIALLLLLLSLLAISLYGDAVAIDARRPLL